MSKWKQVDGDRDFSGVGCTLAKVEESPRQVELVRITPWLEMDPSALSQEYGFWDVCKKTIDFEDLELENKDVRDALKTSGLSARDYLALTPDHKAAVLASHVGYEDSTSTSDFAKALPAPIDQIEFYSGASSSDEVAEINSSMRREVVSNLYGGKYRYKAPPAKALELALGEDPLVVDLNDEEAQALRFALACSRQEYDFSKVPLENQVKIEDTKALGELLSLLFSMKNPVLPPHVLQLLRRGYEAHYDVDPDDADGLIETLIADDSKYAHELGRTILSNLGF